MPIPAGENKDATVAGDATARDDATPAADATPDTGVAATCDNNPAGCEAGRLKGPPPTCACLGGCEAGFTWNGTSCVPDALPDAGPAPDALVFDDAATGNDDAAMGNDDAAMGNDDAAAGNPDAVVVVNPDAAAPADAGQPGRDATPNTPDAAADGGVVVADAGNNRDAGANTPDSGFVPSGLFEGDACNWTGANPCRQEPNMICQQLDPTDPNAGICLKTCAVAQNIGGGTANAACTGGIGEDCLDIGLLPAGGRCLNAIGPYEELVESALDVCNNTVPNLRNVGGACWPLCTVTPSPTNPVNLTCSGGWGTCITEFAFNDADGNTLAACGERVTRSSTCAEARGSFCNATTDRCINAQCHQFIGNSCTGAPACTVAGEVCTTAGAAPNALAFCHQPCGVFQSGACGPGEACELTGFGGGPQGSCRAVTGNQQQDDDCSDVLNFGTRASDCAAGLTCVPFGAVDEEFTEATCAQFCSSTDPMAPACAAPATCNNFGQPFNAFGVCL